MYMQETRKQILSSIQSRPVTGPELADRFDISRAAVWKQIETLRERGFEIKSTGQGYTLDSIPEFGDAAVEFELEAPFEVEFHETLGSTNARARDLANEGHSNVAVLADRQTGGRGRLDREWISPSGGIWLSLLVRPDTLPQHAPAYTLAAATATTRAVRECGVDATIKWPNDVQLGERKLAGVLTEMQGETDRISWLVVGIGLNANLDPDELPAETAATSLQAAVGGVNRRIVTQEIIERFWELVTAERGEITDGWRELNSTLGQRVRIETPGETIIGDAVDVSYPGTLVVETDTGCVEVATGDCEHLRPVE
jgi:BirA family biotin operon repressor/biotin-[acetyl-CoA-carboxylase] ligase